MYTYDYHSNTGPSDKVNNHNIIIDHNGSNGTPQSNTEKAHSGVHLASPVDSNTPKNDKPLSSRSRLMSKRYTSTSVPHKLNSPTGFGNRMNTGSTRSPIGAHVSGMRQSPRTPRTSRLNNNNNNKTRMMHMSPRTPDPRTGSFSRSSRF